MATKTLYFLSTAAASPSWNGNMQDGGSAPTAANTGFGWGPAKTSTGTPYYQARLGASATVTTSAATSYISGATGPNVGTGATNTTAGDTFSANTAYSGTFAAGAWTISPMLRASTAGCVGHLNMRVWRSTNANGSSATELTSGSLVGTAVTLSTTADVNGMGTTTWSPGALTLNNEYLFFQFEWQETTAGTSNTDNVFFRVGTALVTTTNFVASNPSSAVLAGAGGAIFAAVQSLLASAAFAGAGSLTGDAPTFIFVTESILLGGSGGLYGDLQPTGPTLWQGAASLAGAGGIGVAENMSLLAAAVFAGTSVLAAASNMQMPATASFAGASTLTTAEVQRLLAAAGLTGSGIATVAEAQRQLAATLLAGAGLLTGNAVGITLGTYTDPIPYLTIQSGIPAGFTQESGTLTAQVIADTSEPFSDRILNTSSETVIGDLSWGAPGGGLGDAEALALVAVNGTTVNGNRYPTLGVRAQTGAMSGYFFGFNANGGSGGVQVELARWNNGAWISGSTAAFTWATGTWYWVRINDTSNVRHARVWAEGTAEPGTWLI